MGEAVCRERNTGQILWESTLGLNANLPEGKQLAGAAAAPVRRRPPEDWYSWGATSDGRFRAFDAKTGKELWVTRTPAGAQGNSPNINANPMSFLGKSGETACGGCRWDYWSHTRFHDGRPKAAGPRPKGWSSRRR